MSTSTVFNELLKFFGNVLQGAWLLIMDAHHWAHGRWGNRVYGWYAGGGFLLFLIVTIGIEKLLYTVLVVVALGFVGLCLWRALTSPPSGGRRRRP